MSQAAGDEPCTGADEAASVERPRLPFDSDADIEDQPAGPPSPDRVHPRDALFVISGGAVGVASRHLITTVTASQLAQPVIIMVINIAGCLLLGMLLEYLAGRGPDHGHRRAIRLLVGTGMLGGFTTYSTFTVGVQQLLRSGQVVAGVGYGVGSVLAGVLAAAVGVWLGGRVHVRDGS